MSAGRAVICGEVQIYLHRATAHMLLGVESSGCDEVALALGRETCSPVRSQEELVLMLFV